MENSIHNSRLSARMESANSMNGMNGMNGIKVEKNTSPLNKSQAVRKSCAATILINLESDSEEHEVPAESQNASEEQHQPSSSGVALRSASCQKRSAQSEAEEEEDDDEEEEEEEEDEEEAAAASNSPAPAPKKRKLGNNITNRFTNRFEFSVLQKVAQMYEQFHGKLGMAREKAECELQLANELGMAKDGKKITVGDVRQIFKTLRDRAYTYKKRALNDPEKAREIALVQFIFGKKGARKAIPKMPSPVRQMPVRQAPVRQSPVRQIPEKRSNDANDGAPGESFTDQFTFKTLDHVANFYKHYIYKKTITLKEQVALMEKLAKQIEDIEERQVLVDHVQRIWSCLMSRYRDYDQNKVMHPKRIKEASLLQFVGSTKPLTKPMNGNGSKHPPAQLRKPLPQVASTNGIAAQKPTIKRFNEMPKNFAKTGNGSFTNNSQFNNDVNSHHSQVQQSSPEKSNIEEVVNQYLEPIKKQMVKHLNEDQVTRLCGELMIKLSETLQK